jgi:trigger factor
LVAAPDLGSGAARRGGSSPSIRTSETLGKRIFRLLGVLTLKQNHNTLEITLDKKNNTEGLIKIKVSEGDYQPRVEEKLRDYGKKANLKGFRPGKVPAGVIKRMFGQSILVDEINHLLSHKLSDYIKENNLRIIGEPLPNTEKARSIDWESQKDFEFEYQIGMVDNFSYELSSKVKVKSHPITVDDQVIQETISDLRKRFGKVSYPEVSEAGDNLFGELTSKDGTLKKDSMYFATDKISKKEQKKFAGLKKGDVVEFEIEKLFDKEEDLAQLLNISEAEARKTKGAHTLKVETISRVEPAPVDTELFDRVFGKDVAKTEEEFTAKVKETIGSNYQRETEHFLEHHIEDYFLNNTKINLPEDFLKTWLKASGEGKITDDVLANEFESYTRTLKWDLIKGKIAEDNKITVEADEVKARARDLIVSQFGGAAFAEQLQDKLDAITDNYLSHENGQNFMRLYNQLRQDKIMGHIKSLITVVEEPVTVEKFKKIVEEHRH